ncbi:MAG: ABC transporter ATP-binding protein [Candidatus Gracilibacteria bacterium]|jgi:lipoprotein-releasing system ATP-binding protein|nr:ABC transporter ATP-binding protein [Candidatus Gracilibacteria bacterium]
MIQLKKLKKAFRNGGQVWELGEIDLHIKNSEKVSLMGSSGSGKSTLLHLMGTILDFDQGEMLIDGSDVGNMSHQQKADFRNQKIGFVFQDFFLFPEFSLIENVKMPLIIRGENPKIAEEKAREILKEVGLLNKVNNLPSELSGGQRQRGAIARSLITEPKILLADEPTGNLDKKTGDMIIGLLDKLHDKYKMTFVVSTHDEKIAKICPRIVQIEDGKII